MRYAIAVRMNPLLRRAVAGIREWQPVAPGLEAAETSYSAHGWNAPRRLVVVRELLRERPQARGRKLLEVPGYTFHVLVTTLSHDPVQTWRFYNSRAAIENRIKELKEDFGAGGFCLQSFYGTEAAFRLICFLFNLVAQFKREVTQDEAPRLSTLRTKITGDRRHHRQRGSPDCFAPGSARPLAPTLCRIARTHRRARDFNCGAVHRPLKKHRTQPVETPSPSSVTAP